MAHWTIAAALLALAGCIPTTEAHCVATYGDSCGCEAQCMTRARIRAIGAVCDLDCGETTWSCVAVSGRCEVDSDGDGLRDEETVTR